MRATRRTGVRTGRGVRTVGRLALAAVVAAAGVLAGVSPAQAVATRTVAFWSMDEPAGGTVLTDSSGNGRHGRVGDEVVAGTRYDGATAHRFAYHNPADKEYVPGHVDLVPASNDFNPEAGDFSFSIRYRTTKSFGNIMQKGQGGTAGGYWKFEAPEGKPGACSGAATGRRAPATPARPSPTGGGTPSPATAPPATSRCTSTASAPAGSPAPPGRSPTTGSSRSAARAPATA